MIEIHGYDVDELYEEAWWKMEIYGQKAMSRNGPVITIPDPVMLTMVAPTKRVLRNAARDANPFFHIAEVVWMFGGSNNVQFIERFNKRYREYADVGTNTVHGAYGHRWIHHFGVNQLQILLYRLTDDLHDRQAVIGMWDPRVDLPMDPHRDRPCNTSIHFRVWNGYLNMTVINRSNDLIWGALGANVVHFTYLQELVAHMIGMEMGMYRVFTTNLHVYPEMPRFEEIQKGSKGYDHSGYESLPLLKTMETYNDLYKDCILAMQHSKELNNLKPPFRTWWMRAVGWPMIAGYLVKKGKLRDAFIDQIEDEGWHIAARAWQDRRDSDG